MYKLLVRIFDAVGRFFGGIENWLSDGAKLGRVLAVFGLLFAGLALNGTWAVESPEPTDEDAAGQLLYVPANVVEVRTQDGEVLVGHLAEGEGLRMRFGDAPLSPEEEELQLERLDNGELVPWDARESAAGVSILTRGPLPPGTDLVLILDASLASDGTGEVERPQDGVEHTPALVGAGAAVLVLLLLVLRRERVALVIALLTFSGVLVTKAAWFSSLSEQPAVEDVVPETPEAVPEEVPEAVPGPGTEPELPVGDDWLEQLEAELEAEGKLPEDDPIEEAPVEEAPVEDAPVEEAPVEEAPVEEAEVTEEVDLGEELDWLAELEAELDLEDTETTEEPAVAEAEMLPTTLIQVAPKGAFWLWAFGLFLSLLGALSGFIAQLHEGADRAKAAVVLTITGLIVALEEVAERVDRVIAWLERATIAAFLLTMTVLSFVDYMRREFSFFDLEIEGGPNMATLMMVWVGFLGASLATRRGQHLSVDATDRVLSPAAAKLAKRFTAFVAAGLCWQLAKHSWLLTGENLYRGDTVPGLRIWDFLIGPLNGLMALMPEAGDVGWIGLLVGAPLAWWCLGKARRLEERDGAAGRYGAPALEAVAGIAGGAALLCAMPLFWEPQLENGDSVVWASFETGDGFPLYLGALVIPLAFGLMFCRFLVAGVLGRFAKREMGGETPIATPFTGGQRTRKDMIVAALFPGILIGMGATLYFGTGGLILLTGLLLVFVGAPLFVAIGIATMACVILLDDLSGYYVAKDMFEATKKEELLAIPFFVLAGNIMTQGSLAERMIGVARAVMGRTPGGLGLATILACAIFAAISGSSPVTVIAIGGLMYPMLTKDGYSKSYATGVLTSAGSLGIIIPPSIPMILYAIVVSDPRAPMSPNDLFIAGVGPGLLIAGVLMVYTLFRTRPSGEGRSIVQPVLEGGYFLNIWNSLKRGFLALLLPVIILGGIYGILGPIRFTVTEAAAVAVVYALFVEMIIHRELGPRKLMDVLVDSGVMMGSLFVIIVLAIAFNKFLAHQEVPQRAAEWLALHVDSKIQFLIMVNLFLLALGCVMEIISAILIVAPLLAPIAASYGIDPIHFGIIFIVNLELGYLTPPMGINLFVSSTVFERPIMKVIRATVPFLLLMLVCLVIIAWFEPLSTYLVGLSK